MELTRNPKTTWRLTSTVIKLKPISGRSWSESLRVTLLRSLHSVPGRLRIKTDSLRRSSTARAAQSGIVSLLEVSSATVNPVTGSLLIIYDPTRLRADAIWMKLRELGVVSGSMPAPGTGTGGRFTDGLAHQIILNIGAEMFSRAVLALLV